MGNWSQGSVEEPGGVATFDPGRWAAATLERADDVLGRVRELAGRSVDETLSPEERRALRAELDSLREDLEEESGEVPAELRGWVSPDLSGLSVAARVLAQLDLALVALSRRRADLVE